MPATGTDGQDYEGAGQELSEQSRHYVDASAKLLADEHSAPSLVLAEVPARSRVLELGTSTGYMSRILEARGCAVTGVEIDSRAAAIASAHCERMLVGDLDDAELLGQLGDARFDVIVAADVLEHLKDPVGALRRAVAHLAPSGIVVASIPNVAHISVRIALAQGRFPYGPVGLLDHTHLQFFDRQRAFELFELAGLAVIRLTPRTMTAEDSTVPFVRDETAERMLAEAAGDPDAAIYQFVTVAVRLEHEAIAAVAQRMRELYAGLDAKHARQMDAMTHEHAAELQQREEAHAQTLARVTELASGEAELRALLRTAHEQLGERDEALIEFRRRDMDLARRVHELEKLAQEHLDARTYFATESRIVHDRLAAITGSKSWRTIVALRRLRDKLL
jgi:2-polyprenyl-3-methyl-5-hydroxy-6-metoxy-1,4-benzoquinol methylase